MALSFFARILVAFLFFIQTAFANLAMAQSQKDFIKFIELSGLSRRSVGIQELYQKFGSFLPDNEKQYFKGFLDKVGDVKIPKMDVSKIKNKKGAEIYKLSFTQEGQSINLEFGGEKEDFFKLNGQVFSQENSRSFKALAEKLSVPLNDLELSENSHNPSGSGLEKAILTAGEIDQMSPPQRTKYLKELMTLLNVMERLSNLQKEASSSSSSKKTFYEELIILLQGHFAYAVGELCVSGGNIGGFNRNNICELSDTDRVSACKNGQIECNPLFFGNGTCVDNNDRSTLTCEQKANEKGINLEKIYSNSGMTNRDNFLIRLKDAAEAISKPCSRQSDRNVLKKSQCQSFSDTLRRLQSYRLNLNVPVAPSSSAEQRPTVPSVPPSIAPPVPPTIGGSNPAVKCADTDFDISEKAIDCNFAGTRAVNAPSEFKCLDDQSRIISSVKLWKCVCSDNRPPRNGKCSRGPQQKVGEDAKTKQKNDKEKSWIIANKKWLFPFVGSLGILFYSYYSVKKQMKQYYDSIDPVKQNPPASTTPSAPVPRSTH